MVVAGLKVYVGTKGIWLWPNRGCMVVATKGIGHGRTEGGHVEDMVVAGQVYGHQRYMVMAEQRVYDCGQKRVLLWPNIW